MKRIIGFEHYYSISESGKVYNHRTDKYLKPSKNTAGYEMIILRKNGKNHGRMIHRLVAIHFVKGMTEMRNEVNHMDGDKLNNNSSNLEWVSRSENAIHAFKNKLMVSGEQNNFSKLSSLQVLEIKNLKGKRTQREISDMYGVSQSNISYIHNDKTWKH